MQGEHDWIPTWPWTDRAFFIYAYLSFRTFGSKGSNRWKTRLFSYKKNKVKSAHSRINLLERTRSGQPRHPFTAFFVRITSTVSVLLGQLLFSTFFPLFPTSPTPDISISSPDAWSLWKQQGQISTTWYQHISVKLQWQPWASCLETPINRHYSYYGSERWRLTGFQLQIEYSLKGRLSSLPVQGNQSMFGGLIGRGAFLHSGSPAAEPGPELITVQGHVYTFCIEEDSELQIKLVQVYYSDVQYFLRFDLGWPHNILRDRNYLIWIPR